MVWNLFWGSVCSISLRFSLTKMVHRYINELQSMAPLPSGATWWSALGLVVPRSAGAAATGRTRCQLKLKWLGPRLMKMITVFHSISGRLSIMKSQPSVKMLWSHPFPLPGTLSVFHLSGGANWEQVLFDKTWDPEGKITSYTSHCPGRSWRVAFGAGSIHEELPFVAAMAWMPFPWASKLMLSCQRTSKSYLSRHKPGMHGASYASWC